MKKIFLLGTMLAAVLTVSAKVDMQAHMGTSEAQEAYSTYQAKQKAYYSGNYSYDELRKLSGNDLFGALNALMGSTSRIGNSSFSYGSLRYAYKDVDKDLNKSGYIIGYYDGYSLNGAWDGGKTWNREHTWPQSKGANQNIPMGHDMQSVRPTNTSVNSDRGNTAYGESWAYYDPDEVSINNTYYNPANLGSYRGDAARVILYDYVVYGEAGGHKNSLYNGEAQLLSKLGGSGVFESIPVLLKWHMNDPVSLTEMVRNDGGQNYQGNRNPFIDYPEMAIEMLQNVSGVTTYTVTATGAPLWPAYRLTLKSGFIAYLGTKDSRPEYVTVTGASYSYNKENGRLTLTNVTGKVSISSPWEEEEVTALEFAPVERHSYKTIRHGQVVIVRDGKIFNVLGQMIQ